MQIYHYRRDEFFKKIDIKLVKNEIDDLDLPFVWDEYFYLKIAYYLKISTTVFFINHLMEEVKSKKYSEEDLGAVLINQFKLKFRIFPTLMASKDFDNKEVDFEFEYSISDLYSDEDILEADARGEFDLNIIDIKSKKNIYVS